MNQILAAVALSMIGFCQCSAAQVLVLNTTAAGYPPFFINKGKEKGIMYDVLAYVSEKHGYQLETVMLPKKRVVIEMDKGHVDVEAAAKEWVATAGNYLFSDVVIEVRDLLFSLKNEPVKFENVEDLIGKTIGIHHGYYYPLLDSYFGDGRIKTLADSSEFLMLKNAYFSRTDATVVNELVGKWIIKNHPELQNQFVVSDTAVDSFEYRMMFTKKWQGFLGVFNRELALMKKNGKLAQIFNQYSQ